MIKISGILLSFLTSGQLTFSYTNANPLIPKPVSFIANQGEYIIDSATKLKITPYNKETYALASFIRDFLSKPLGSQLSIAAVTTKEEKNSITISIDESADMPDEGYTLGITPEQITIKAKKVTGAFWGFQTLRQLMPAVVNRQLHLKHTAIQISCGVINDFPRFAYRGLLLDVARHFFSVDFIKKLIDVMAAYKLNKLHLHLTDDQGWRIEIKKYPKLQKIAAYREKTLIGHKKSQPHRFDEKEYGGYYTQEDLKEIVVYAQSRHIEVIPEIELPGHCLAALAAYPELGCMGGQYKTACAWGIHDDVYCVGNEKTFEFLEGVLQEVMALFPSNYIHIGGDEVKKGRWKECPKCQACIKAHNLKNENELQSYCIKRIEVFINAHGKQIIGWDEILEGGLAPHATVMSWRGVQGGINAARKSHQVIMTPFEHLYFDLYQSQSADQPLAIGGYIPLEKVYAYEPIPSELTEQEQAYVLGAQANIWTEYIATPEQVEYMAFPRALALAEITWASAQKDYADFLTRLQGNLSHLRAMNVYYADWQPPDLFK